jgi:hypothetical protein
MRDFESFLESRREPGLGKNLDLLWNSLALGATCNPAL